MLRAEEERKAGTRSITAITAIANNNDAYNQCVRTSRNPADAHDGTE